MILLTGAAGKTGRAILRALARRGVKVRALVRSDEQKRNMLQLGAQEVHVGDLRDTVSLAKAMHGIRRVYYICPNITPDEVQIGETLLSQAREAGVQRFVYHSVLHPQIESMPHHWQKMRMEEKVFESSLEFTILQPCAYMQNTLASWRSIVDQGRYPVPYATSSRISIVDLEDVAESAAMILTQMNHKNAIYELAGPQPLSQVEMAEILSRVLQHPVAAVALERKEWAENSRQSGMGETQIDTLLRMFEYYERYGLLGSPQVLEFLLGRPATTFDCFVKRQVEITTRSSAGGMF